MLITTVPFKPIALASKAIAQDSLVNVSLHLDHAESELLVQEALDLGFDSIMFDGSKLDYASNVRASVRMAQLCRQYGATIEVELGEVGVKMVFTHQVLELIPAKHKHLLKQQA